MARHTLKTGIATALLGATLLAGCFTTADNGYVAPKPNPDDTTVVQNPDTTKPLPKPNDTNIVEPKPKPIDTSDVVINKGWDDFPNKYLPTLKMFAADMSKLPAPYGLRYDARPLPQSKIAAGPECPDGNNYEVFGLGLPATNPTFFVVDTIQYHSLTGEASCRWMNGRMAKVTHVRHILDMHSGQAWESITDSIAGETTVLPHHSITGTGRMLLNSNMEIAIRSWRVDMKTPPSSGAIVQGGHLKLDWSSYAFDMKIVKKMPFTVSDLFHVNGPTVTEPVLGGPIVHPGSGKTAGKIDTVGFIELHSDHSVVIRKWDGEVVTP